MTSLSQPARLHALDGPIEPERHPLSRDFVWGVSTPSYQIEGAARWYAKFIQAVVAK
jgi:hypothetical protein